MILSRLISIILRFGEFVCAAVVLGIIAYFLHQYDKYHIGPEGREIYTCIVAAISTILSLVWMIPFTHQFLHYPSDFVISAAWFAAFGILVDWIGKINCGNTFHWGGIYHGNYCDKWRAAEAFSFLSACFWLASCLLGIYVYHRLRRDQAVAYDNTPRSRRYFRRTYV